MFGYGKCDAADHALETLSEEQWASLAQRAAWLVLQTLRADGAASVDPERVTASAADVIVEFCEGRECVEVHRGVEGDDLVEAILRGLAPLLRERARGRT